MVYPTLPDGINVLKYIEHKTHTSMENRVLTVVITGATSGIGRATALEFARKGYKLALTARRQDILNAVAAECDRLGGQTFTWAIDVSDEQMVYEFAKKANSEFGSIDIWVNNAAVAMMGPFEETPMESIRRLLDVNLMGYMYGARTALSYFRKQNRGTLINVASQVSLSGQPYSIAYTTSKSAIRGMTKCLQQEMAYEENINICSVLPATIDTPLFQNAANYMGRKVKAMEPVIDARTVAEEIVSLVKHPKPEVMVGYMASLGMVLNFLAPNLSARLYNKQVKDKHFSDELTEPNPGNLFEPKEQASIDGGWLEGKDSDGMSARVSSTFWMALITGSIIAASATAAVLIKRD